MGNMLAPGATYWNEYTNFQHIKHKIIREYLNGWFPKLGNWAGRIVYLDTHAGRGKYKTGDEGSPVVALKTFLEHKARDTILQKCQLVLYFLESDPSEAKLLQEALDPYEKCHPKIALHVLNVDAFDQLTALADELERSGRNMAPFFMFVDPYGFRLPYTLLKRFKSHPRSELLINVMWRELDMAIRNTLFEKTLDEMMGSHEWVLIRKITEEDNRAEEMVQFLRKQLGSQWATYIRMSDSNRIRYFLLHLTDHDEGRDLMKLVFWKCSPDSGFSVSKSDNPKQQFLIMPEPDLRPLELWLKDLLSKNSYTWIQLTDKLRDEVWMNKHLWERIKLLLGNGQIKAINYTGRLSQKANPTFALVHE